MAIELKFSKPDSSTAWGFRLVGGVDFEQPLVVVKVNEDSLAEAAGLQLGDIIVRVNDTPTAGLTHVEAHDLIHSAGLNFVVAIRRGAFPDILHFINEELTDAEVCCILNQNTDNSRMLQKTPDQIENLSGQEKILTVSSSGYNPIRGSKQKYSTFLQKPEGPKPVPKKVEEQRKIIGEPYKVKIVKQKKKYLRDKKQVTFEPQIIEVDGSYKCEESSVQGNEAKIEENIAQDDAIVQSSDNEEIDEEFGQSPTMEDIDEKEVLTSEDEETNANEKAPPKSNSPIIIKSKPLDIHIEPVPESSLSLEEQLAAVQKQLLALSQLPSAIQTTLEAVTQQLNKIVSAKAAEVDNSTKNEDEDEDQRHSVEEEDENRTEGEPLDDGGASENSGEISDNEEEASSASVSVKKTNSVEDEEQSDIEIHLEQQEDQENEPEEEIEVGPYAGLTEEEKEAKIKQEELLAKKQNIERWNQSWPWCDRQKPIYSINFLKYTPPPKNLDYLQHSDVYRMVHDMEGPTKGIGSRAEKILSEQDYYEEKGAP